MKKIIVNQSISVNILKIAFVMIVFVSGVGEVRAFLNPTTMDKPNTRGEDTACKDAPLHGSCDFSFLGVSQAGVCIPTKNGSNLYCENIGDAVVKKNDDCVLVSGKLTYYEGRPCRRKVDNSDPNPPARGVCLPNGTNQYICELKASDYCAYYNCASKDPSKPYCIKKSPGTYECSSQSPCNSPCNSSTEKCQIDPIDNKGKCVPKSDYKCPTDCATTPNTPYCVKTKDSPETWECKTSAEKEIPPGYTVDPSKPPIVGSTTPAPTIEYVEFKNPIKFNNLIELLGGITNALLTLLGVIAVLVIMASGFKYMTSSNPGEVSQAVGGIKNAVIGIVVIMGAYLIVNYVISAVL